MQVAPLSWEVTRNRLTCGIFSYAMYVNGIANKYTYEDGVFYTESVFVGKIPRIPKNPANMFKGVVLKHQEIKETICSK